MQLATIRVVLVRHGQSEDNLNSIWAGHKDSPLSATGINQAKALGASLATLPIDAIYSSDLKRARRTAEEILAANKSVPPPPLVQAQTFREQNFGQAEGRSWHDANWANSSSGDNARTFRFPEGESLDEVNARMGVAVRRYILPRLEALRNKPETATDSHIVVVAHGIAIAELLRVFMSLHDASTTSSPWPDPRTSYKRVRMENTGWTLVELAVPTSSDAAESSGEDLEAPRGLVGSINKDLPPEPTDIQEGDEVGQAMQDIVEGPAETEGALALQQVTSTPPTISAASVNKKKIFVRIAQQNNTEHLRNMTSGQGPSSSRILAGAIIAGGGELSGDTADSTSRAHQAYDARYMVKELEKASSLPSSTGDPATHSSRTGSISKAGTNGNSHPPNVESAPGAWSDAWPAICVRVLPLYNGEDLRGSIEELNELVSAHAHRHLSRSPARALDSLSKDLHTVCAAGTYTLFSHLSTLPINDDARLLSRLADIWTMFFTSILPCIEACFLPLETDPVLVSLSKKDDNASQASSTSVANAALGASASSGGMPSTASYSNSAPSQGVSLRGPRIEVRKIALTVFRDHLILPINERLFFLFGHVRDFDVGREAGANGRNKGLLHPGAPSSLYDDTQARAASSHGFTSDDGESSLSVYPPLLQMSSILAGLLSHDEAQSTIDGLLRALRVGYDSTATMSYTDHGLPSLNRMPGDASRLLDLASRDGVSLGSVGPTRPSHRHGWLPRSAVKHGTHASNEDSAETPSSLPDPLSAGARSASLSRGGSGHSNNNHMAISREDAYLSALRSPALSVEEEEEEEGEKEKGKDEETFKSPMKPSDMVLLPSPSSLDATPTSSKASFPAAKDEQSTPALADHDASLPSFHHRHHHTSSRSSSTAIGLGIEHEVTE